MSRPLLGLSVMKEPAWVEAALPLFAAEAVEALEWSFDTGWNGFPLPDWGQALLDDYEAAGRLYGHGVGFSVLSAEWSRRQELWLDCFREEVATRAYRHVSEHFGFMCGGDFHRSAPMPVPLTERTLAIGQARLRTLQTSCGLAVGLENLALSLSARDVAEHGRFLDDLLAPVDGFLLLDLHNLYCQACNFGLAPTDLLAAYPLARVRELHVSGGSWSESPSAPGRRIRRDTHDDAVPEPLFALLPEALRRCPHVELVIFERLGDTFRDAADMARYRADFQRLREIVDAP